jgi:hypothetical protein
VTVTRNVIGKVMGNMPGNVVGNVTGSVTGVERCSGVAAHASQ